MKKTSNNKYNAPIKSTATKPHQVAGGFMPPKGTATKPHQVAGGFMPPNNSLEETPKSHSKTKFFIAGILLLIAIIVTILAVVIPDKQSQSQEKPLRLTFDKQGSAMITGPDGKEKAIFDLEIAETPDQQKTGLMYRESMADNQGMLFVYQKADKMNFWMKNTYLPLDIVFFLPDSTIYKVYPNNTPFSESGIAPAKECLLALEMNAGQAAVHNLAPGDKIYWKRMKN